MRALVFLLVLANLLLFAWTQGYFGESASPDAARVNQQLNPQGMRIVSSGEPPSNLPPAPAVPAVAADSAPAAVSAPAVASASPPPEACLAWSGLIAADADRLTRDAAEKAPEARTERRTEATTARSWWVFMPPLPTKLDAERKLAELKKLEIDEFYLIQDAGPNRLAISLGVFSTEAAARAYLEKLRSKGVKSAKVGPRGVAEAQFTVELRGHEAQLAGLRTALGERVPGDCPPPATPASSKP